MGAGRRVKASAGNLGWPAVRTGDRHPLRRLGQGGSARPQPRALGHAWRSAGLPAWPGAAGDQCVEPGVFPRKFRRGTDPVFQLVEHHGDHLRYGDGRGAWPWPVAEPPPHRNLARAGCQPPARLADRPVADGARVPPRVGRVQQIRMDRRRVRPWPDDGAYPAGAVRTGSLVAVSATVADHPPADRRQDASRGGRPHQPQRQLADLLGPADADCHDDRGLVCAPGQAERRAPGLHSQRAPFLHVGLLRAELRLLWLPMAMGGLGAGARPTRSCFSSPPWA